MKFNKLGIKRLNDLLISVREHRDEVIEVISALCPNKIEECDAQLSTSSQAIDCPYFTLCNVLGSYSMISEEDREEAKKFLIMVYESMDSKKRGCSGLYS